MNGIQHLFRQQAVDKQASVDSWHSANQSFMHPYANGRSGSPCNSNGDIKPPNWSQGKLPSSTCINCANFTRIFAASDRVLDQLHESSSPQSVPTQTVKSPSQEFSSHGSNGSTSRWKRSSPDPNKMMMGRSPNIMDVNAKRILQATPSRRQSNQVERVGSPSLSGYPVRSSHDCLKCTILILPIF